MGKGPYISNIEYPEFGNYYLSTFVVDNIVFNSVEQYFQYQKCIDSEDKLKIINCKNPEQCAKLGRMVKLRPDWEQIKNYIMYKGVLCKLLYNYKLILKLLSTTPRTLFVVHFSAKNIYFHENRTLSRDYWDIENSNILTDIRKKFLLIIFLVVCNVCIYFYSLCLLLK